MSFASFLQRFRARQQAPPPALPPVPAYQGPIRQDLNLFELTGQTMGAPAVPLSTEAQALAQLANFMALRQQAQGGAVPPILGPLAQSLPRTPNTLGSSVPMPTPADLNAVAAANGLPLPFPPAIPDMRPAPGTADELTLQMRNEATRARAAEAHAGGPRRREAVPAPAVEADGALRAGAGARRGGRHAGPLRVACPHHRPGRAADRGRRGSQGRAAGPGLGGAAHP
ncbi:MAG: hypothetical protein M3R02_04485, partial [Chloroflexota bacterium]|nr:hypothetical protein [Chloroflexota bacterium]